MPMRGPWGPIGGPGGPPALRLSQRLPLLLQVTGTRGPPYTLTSFSMGPLRGPLKGQASFFRGPSPTCSLGGALRVRDGDIMRDENYFLSLYPHDYYTLKGLGGFGVCKGLGFRVWSSGVSLPPCNNNKRGLLTLSSGPLKLQDICKLHLLRIHPREKVKEIWIRHFADNPLRYATVLEGYQYEALEAK